MLILASASPRRRELLTQAGFSFQVEFIPVAEEPRPGEDPIHLVKRLAREKADAVFRAHNHRHAIDDSLLVLGADTVVVCDHEILNKPVDEADAARMLRLLAGRTHQVITGVCLISSHGVEVAAETTRVTMLTMSDEEILAYVATREPMDKAGAYAIQGHAECFVTRLCGSYSGVIGLPLAQTAALLRAAGLLPKSSS